MLSPSSKRLADDHNALSELLRQLQEALIGKDLAASYARLDLFWAKLAVHIRAEHLHLFPAIVKNSNSGSLLSPISQPSSVEARWTISRLRADHEFMMHELAGLMESMRELSKVNDSARIAKELAAIREVTVELEKRLVIHNEFEEGQVYRWISSVMDEPEQSDLAASVEQELRNRPPRFTL